MRRNSHHSPLWLARTALTLMDDRNYKIRLACENVCNRYAVEPRVQMIEKTRTVVEHLLHERQLKEAERQVESRGESWITKFYGN